MPESRRGGHGAKRTAASSAGEDGPVRTRRPSIPAGEMPAAPSDDQPVADDARPPVCSIAFCPICTLVTAVGDARPELLDHLILASREVLLAVRALIDSRLEGMAPSPKLERLTIG